MAFVIEHYLKLSAGYLFPEIARRVAAFASANPSLAARIIRCGIGDVTEPLPQAAIAAMHAAVDELAHRETFKGYGPGTGYDFVRTAIADGDFRSRGIAIAEDEIFLSDGSKGDCGAVLEILASGGGANRIAITDPVYPVYVDSNVMFGNTGGARADGRYDGLVYMPCTAANNFVADIPAEPVDIVYLCFPNNPTGAMIDRSRLEAWVAYALKNKAIILYDVAYDAYIRDPTLPRSIYEIPGAHECAMEFHSFSKSGGFTGVRCGYTVLPKALHAFTKSGQKVGLNALWTRRWNTRSNGVSYPVQAAAAALYSPQGKAQVKQLVDFYIGNAAILREGCSKLGLRVFGGEHAPYVWVECPDKLKSWDFFDRMLSEANVVITPGAGFGACGEGYFRISSFNSRANVKEVVRRMTTMCESKKEEVGSRK
ncbi:MAG: LL-diaminopimelate aminotransferase [Phycisphaerae bacterium]|nr:LL-diaminopimelate aminotransferase [Phycisphaerae bacterium]